MLGNEELRTRAEDTEYVVTPPSHPLLVVLPAHFEFVHSAKEQAWPTAWKVTIQALRVNGNTSKPDEY